VATVAALGKNLLVRRLISSILAVATLAPAMVAFVAVSMTPSSAHALPVFEFSTAKGPLRVTAAELGARKTGDGLKIDDAMFDQTIKRLQVEFARHAKPGTYELKPDHTVLLHQGTPGLEIDPAGMRQLLIRALRGSRSHLKLPTRSVAPRPAPTNAIVVNLGEFGLDLYRGPQLERHFPVGVGALSFPTPPGAYYVRSKAMNPTWRNPGSRWSRGMPSYIPPGPRNPLGTRAMRLDRGALVIHGTPQPWSIGHRSSHGCIRMRRDDIENLYDLVPQGTPVFIVP
jgi:lipoprotein-anchoring transpeptidase ErfK/SrfK